MFKVHYVFLQDAANFHGVRFESKEGDLIWCFLWGIQYWPDLSVLLQDKVSTAAVDAPWKLMNSSVDDTRAEFIAIDEDGDESPGFF